MSNSGEPQMVDTGQGVLVGVEPAQPRRASDWSGNSRPDQAVSQPAPAQSPQPAQERPAYRWTDEDIEAARRQEKDKLYGRIEEMSSKMEEFAAARAAEQEEKQRLAEEAENARKAKEESEMEIRDLLVKREAEMQAEIAKINARYDADREIFTKERQLQDAELYRRDRLAQEAQEIIPELRELVTGSTPEAIDASIEAMKQRTAAILANFLAAEPQAAPYQPRGATPTAPPVGPMEQLPSYEQLTPQQLRDMDMETYKKHRPQLLQASNPYRRG